MGVELNFITKPDKGWPATKFITVLFTLMVFASAATLWGQWNHAANVVAAADEAREAAQQESLALMTAPETGERSETEIRAIAKQLNEVKSASVAHGTIYAGVVQALGESVTLNTFDSMDGRMIQISGVFVSSEDVTAAVSRLQELPYVLNARPSDITENGGSYTAGMALIIDGRMVDAAPDEEVTE